MALILQVPNMKKTLTYIHVTFCGKIYEVDWTLVIMFLFRDMNSTIQ
jgi:hypothetical protein